MTIEEIIGDVLRAEGGYVNHPSDKGGATNLGITMTTLATYRGKPVTEDDVRNLTEAEARQIYRKMYFSDPGFDKLPGLLWSPIVDAGVNHGPGTAVRMLQKALGLPTDGVIGPETILAANKRNPQALLARFLAERARKYARIIQKDPTQAVFAAGWINRLADQIENSA